MLRIAIVAVIALLAVYLIMKTGEAPSPGQPPPHALDQSH